MFLTIVRLVFLFLRAGTRPTSPSKLSSRWKRFLSKPYKSHQSVISHKTSTVYCYYENLMIIRCILASTKRPLIVFVYTKCKGMFCITIILMWMINLFGCIHTSYLSIDLPIRKNNTLSPAHSTRSDYDLIFERICESIFYVHSNMENRNDKGSE